MDPDRQQAWDDELALAAEGRWDELGIDDDPVDAFEPTSIEDFLST